MSLIIHFSFCLSLKRGESALQIAVCRGHLDMVKVHVQVYRDFHMESEIDQYHVNLANYHHHEHVVEYLSHEFPSLKRKVICHSLYWHTPVCAGVRHAFCCCCIIIPLVPELKIPTEPINVGDKMVVPWRKPMSAHIMLYSPYLQLKRLK